MKIKDTVSFFEALTAISDFLHIRLTQLILLTLKKMLGKQTNKRIQQQNKKKTENSTLKKKILMDGSLQLVNSHA